MTLNRGLFAIGFAVAISGFQEAAAQQATSFEQLQVLVKVGDTVNVTESTGLVTEGKIVDLSRSSLRLQVNGVNRDLSQKDVMEIKQRKGDPLKNGAKIGALVGLGIGVLGAIALCVDDATDSCAGWAAGAIGFYTGVGTAIGVGIDALIKGTHTIYRPGISPASSRLTIKPYVSPRVRGVQVAFSF